MLSSLFNQSTSTMDTGLVLLASLVSIVLGIAIALTHKYTSAYNKNYLVTISLLPLLVQTVIIVVNGNLGMGIVVAGTFGLVKFRSVPGTSKEILSVFFAMTVGLATGIGCIMYAVIITIIGSLVMIILSKVPIYEKNKYEKTLTITIPEDLDYSDVFNKILEKYTKSYELLLAKTTALGSMFELKYNVVLKKDISEKKFVDELRTKNGNLRIMLSQRMENTEL